MRSSGALYERPWRDFATNRSEALDLARSFGTYSLIIDADDTLEVPANFAMPPLSADSYHLTIDYAGSLYDRPALVRAALPWRYEGVIHEFLVCEAARTTGFLPMRIIINQDGARRRDPTTYRKDAVILETALADAKTPFLEARYTFYLAQSYRDCGEHARAIDLYLRRADLGFWDEERYVSLLGAGRLQAVAGEPLAVVLGTFDRAIAIVPGRAEARHAASRACRLAEDYARGVRYAEAAVDLPQPGGALFCESWIYAYGALDELAVCAYWTGAYRTSLDATLRALESGVVPPAEQPRIVANARFAFSGIGGCDTGQPGLG